MKKHQICLLLMVVCTVGNLHASASCNGRLRHGAKGLLEGSMATLGGLATLHIATELKQSAYNLSMPGYLDKIPRKELVWDAFVTLSALFALGYATWTLGTSSKDSLMVYFEGSVLRKREPKRMLNVS